MEVILVILGIIAAVSSFFKDSEDTDTPIPKRRNNSPRPTPTPSGGGGSRSSAQNTQDESRSQTTIPADSIEEQQYEQRKQLAERMNTMEYRDTQSEHDAISHHHTRKPGSNLSSEERRLKKRMNNNLTRTGLINGIIMSEVLGQPRAVRPYRNIVAQRKK